MPKPKALVPKTRRSAKEPVWLAVHYDVGPALCGDPLETDFDLARSVGQFPVRFLL